VSRIYMRHVICKGITSYIDISYTHDTCRVCHSEWLSEDVSHIYMRHVICKGITSYIDISHTHDTCRVCHNVIRDSFICDTYIWGMLYIKESCHMWRESFICKVWLILARHDSVISDDMTHAYVTWLIHMWHDSFTCDMTHAYETWLIHIWHENHVAHGWVMFHMNESYHK